jgi:hypothetical protein
MRHRTRWMIIPLAALALGSCNETVNSDTDKQTNTPVVVNTADAFTFTVDAFHLNFNVADSLSFSGTPVVRSLVVSEYRSGSGYIIVEGAGTTVLLSDTLSSNRIIAGTEYSASAPTRIAIALTDYSGKVTFALARK